MKYVTLGTMNYFMTLARRRCSVRAYTQQKIEKNIIESVLEAGQVAPSACNRQPWMFLVIQSAEGLGKLKKAARIFNAPAAVVILGDGDTAWRRTHDGKDFVDVDTTIAATHMVLQAEDLGLSSCWICSFNPDIITEQFNIPPHLRPVHILTLGYDDNAKKPADRHGLERKHLKDLVVGESF
ncbi:MAG: nitroreductase family protein [Spirochaetales bacterium]|nr:nitroreductase family protein [Spirochaetales bacterium]